MKAFSVSTNKGIKAQIHTCYVTNRDRTNVHLTKSTDSKVETADMDATTKEEEKAILAKEKGVLF
jgi:hypothetical protein